MSNNLHILDQSVLKQFELNAMRDKEVILRGRQAAQLVPCVFICLYTVMGAAFFDPDAPSVMCLCDFTIARGKRLLIRLQSYERQRSQLLGFRSNEERYVAGAVLQFRSSTTLGHQKCDCT